MTIGRGAHTGNAGTSAGIWPLASAALPIAAIAGCLVCVWFGFATIAGDLPTVQATFPIAPYAIDGHRSLVVASVVESGGSAYSVAGFFYSPIGAWLMIPLAWLGTTAGIWAWFAIKLGILTWCVVDATRGQPWPVRALATAFTLTLTFVLDDLWLGNVSILLGGAIYLAVSREQQSAAIPLGILFAAIAKPFMLPLLAWMIVFRRASAASLLAAFAATSAIAVAVFGLTEFRDYFDALWVAANLNSRLSLGLSGVAPQLLVPASVAVLTVFAILLWKSRDESSVLLWSLLAGLIAAPYVAHYSVVPVLAGIPAFARVHPTRAMLLGAVVAPVSLVAILPATVIGLLIAFPTDVLGGMPRGRTSVRTQVGVRT